MQVLRYQSISLNAVSTRWNRAGCGELRNIMNGPPYASAPIPVQSYDNYAFGARHLQAVFLSVFSLHTTTVLCRILSHASILLMVIAAWRNRWGAAAVLLPVFAALALAFDQPWWGYNITNLSPGFFVGFFSLAFFLGAPAIFSRETSRLAFFSFLGTVTAFFDNMHGPIPVLLSLAIVFDQFFYGGKRSPAAAAVQAIIIFTCFVSTFFGLTAIRMVLLHLGGADFGWIDFVAAVGPRLRDTIPAPDGSGVIQVSAAGVFARLWSFRRFIFDEETSSTLLLAAGPVAWATVAAALVYLRKLPADIVSLAVAALGILLWYPLFPNHSAIHAWLMVRMLSLPAAYGFSALASLGSYMRAVKGLQPVGAAVSPQQPAC